MTPPKPVIFKSRVGKRVVLLFVVSALLPLWVLAMLSMSQVRELLIDQGDKRLAGTAKDYALAVHERLLNAGAVAKLFVAQPEGTAVIPPYFADQYLSVGRAGAAGLAAIKGDLPPEAGRLVDEYRGMASPPASLLRTVEGERLFFLFESPGSRGGEVVIGELNPAYVWGESRDLNAGTRVCVVDSTRMQYLHCPNGREMGLPQLITSAGAGAVPSDVVWSSSGVTYRGQILMQPMKQKFGSNDWYFAISVPESQLLVTAGTSRRNFMLVIALALLLIAWVSVGQIRAMVVPLGRLTAGTRRIADNKFGTQVTVETDDEFGELGDAFNSMSTRLGRQFHVSKAYAEIDRMILVRDDLDNIVENMLRQLQALFPALKIYAVLLDRVESSLARRLSLRAGPLPADDALNVESVTVSPAERPDLAAVKLSARKTGGDEPAWSHGVDLSGSDTEWVLPLVWGRNVCGWLWLIGPEDATSGDDDRRIISDLAGRVALAVASVWRDEELYQQAHFDPLTGLPNRLLFGDRLQREIAHGKRESRTTAVLFVDLDHFKSVNDSQGHNAGDQLLCEAARRIVAAVREIDTVSRHGGDEFTVLLADIHEQRDALRVGDAIVSALSAPFSIDGQDSFLSASVGIAIHPVDGATAEELLKNADTAMYRAKTAGRAQAMFFEERMNVETIARLAIDRELRHAMVHGEFELYFQPQVFLDSNRVLAAEALLRWHHPQRGLLAPGEFMEVAEESGQISAIGRWVIERACDQITSWRRAGLELDRIAVNVSGRQLRDADFVEHIQRHVVAKGLASSIEFEITETAMMERLDLVADKLKALADAGCRITLDDFGTGYSSLGYLKKLPVHLVKIDRAFIFDIDKSAESLLFVESIIAMAHAMGKIVVAEGVESDAQVRLLRDLECDIVQGYHFSKPLSSADLLVFAKGFDRL